MWVQAWTVIMPPGSHSVQATSSPSVEPLQLAFRQWTGPSICCLSGPDAMSHLQGDLFPLNRTPSPSSLSG